MQCVWIYNNLIHSSSLTLGFESITQNIKMLYKKGVLEDDLVVSRTISVDLCDDLPYCVRIGYTPYGIAQ